MSTDFTVEIIGDFHTDTPEQAVIEMAEWLADPSEHLTMRVSFWNEAGVEETVYMDLADAFKGGGK